MPLHGLAAGEDGLMNAPATGNEVSILLFLFRRERRGMGPHEKFQAV